MWDQALDEVEHVRRWDLNLSSSAITSSSGRYIRSIIRQIWTSSKQRIRWRTDTWYNYSWLYESMHTLHICEAILTKKEIVDIKFKKVSVNCSWSCVSSKLVEYNINHLSLSRPNKVFVWIDNENANRVHLWASNARKLLITCSVPPPPVFSPSSDTLTIVQGSAAFQWKSTTLSLSCIQSIYYLKDRGEGKHFLQTPMQRIDDNTRTCGQHVWKISLGDNLNLPTQHYSLPFQSVSWANLWEHKTWWIFK